MCPELLSWDSRGLAAFFWNPRSQLKKSLQEQILDSTATAHWKIQKQLWGLLRLINQGQLHLPARELINIEIYENENRAKEETILAPLQWTCSVFILLFSQCFPPGLDFVVWFCNSGSFMSRKTMICFPHIFSIKIQIRVQNLVMYWRNGPPLSNHDGPHSLRGHLQNIWDVVFYKNKNLLLDLEARKFRINMSANSVPPGDPWFIDDIFYIRTLVWLECKGTHIVMSLRQDIVTFQRFHLLTPLGCQDEN